MNTKAHHLFGVHAVAALLRKHPERIRRLWVQITAKDRLKELMQQAAALDIAVQELTTDKINEHFSSANHQGIVAECTPSKALTETELMEYMLQPAEKPRLILALDGVQDPHNLGACLRVADAVQVDAVIAPKDKSVGLTPVVCKVASGAAEFVPFYQVTNLTRTLRWLQDQGCWVYGATEEASQSIYDADFTSSSVIVMGSEGPGLRKNTKATCDVLVHIPMLGSVDSLNVSVATGICLFEAGRQRR